MRKHYTNGRLTHVSYEKRNRDGSGCRTTYPARSTTFGHFTTGRGTHRSWTRR